MKTFAGRVAVITGAASGFGRAFAHHAADLKMRLVLADISAEPLATVADELRSAGAEVESICCDVSQEASVQALAEAALKRFGAAHLLFNNAGVGSGGLVWENTVKDWQWILGVNLWGVIHGVRTFTPLMLEAAKADKGFEGHIVNVASVAGLLNPTLLGAYNVSKHAVVSLSESLFHDLNRVQGEDQRVHASVLCPAFVPTGIGHSHRHRPAELRDQAAPTDSMMKAQSMVGHAVSKGKLSADDVANITFRAIADAQFYVFTHPQFMAGVKLRFDDIVNLRNPNPLAGTPPQ